MCNSFSPRLQDGEGGIAQANDFEVGAERSKDKESLKVGEM